jgi:DMSO/TMAO reductase YedYZ molybdopterin-dependent catalytic subunit
LAGVAAAAVALAVAELVTVATGSESGPLVAVGGVVVDNSPEPVTEFGIEVFGTNDKNALLIGTIVLLAGFAAGLGALAVRWLWVGLAGLVGFAAIGVAAALSRHEAPLTAAVPTIIGALAAGTAFVALARPASIMDFWARHADDTRGKLHDRAGLGGGGGVGDRRGFLKAAGWTLGAAVVAGLGGRWVATRRDVSEARAAVALPVPVDPAPAVPAAAELEVQDLATYVTSNRTFYRIDTALAVPQVDPEGWELRIHGRVRNPYTISFQELLARPMVERYVTLACVSNEVGGELIGNARWLGVPVAELLAEAGPESGADQVVSRSVDGWTCGTPTSVLTDGRDALLAIGMNGVPLPIEHGFPVRMVVPGLYGYVSACKWITEIELSSFADYDAYWIPRGWAQQAPIKTQSRIDTPRSRATAGTVMVAGVAWAQQRGIERVEVQVDGGDWQPAELADTVSADTWRQWLWRWEAVIPGEHQLAVRATDSTGETQPSEPQPPAPDGATGWHTVQVEVR